MTMKELLKGMSDAFNPNYWAEKMGNKTGAYDKAHNSKLANWSRNLTGWKWWAWQIVGGLIFVAIAEFILNLLGLSMLPWRW